MTRIAIAGPLLPGKEEPWRRFVQEVTGSRAEEYEGMKRRLGFCNETLSLVRVPRELYKGALVFVRLEAEKPEEIVQRLEASEHPFDLWLKDRLLEFHGYSLSDSSCRAPELIFTGTAFPLPTNPMEGKT